MTIENKPTADSKRITFDKKFDKLNLKYFAENLLKNMEKGTVSFIGDIIEEYIQTLKIGLNKNLPKRCEKIKEFN